MPFTRFGHLFSHLNSHVSGRPHACDDCQKVFHCFVVYQLHWRILHGERRLPISKSQLEFVLTMWQQRDRQKKRHNSLVQAQILGARLRNLRHKENTKHSASFNAESEVQFAHHSEPASRSSRSGRQHRCRYCQESFVRSSDLTTHTLQHMGLGTHQTAAASRGDRSVRKRSSNPVLTMQSQTSSETISQVHMLVRLKLLIQVRI